MVTKQIGVNLLILAQRWRILSPLKLALEFVKHEGMDT